MSRPTLVTVRPGVTLAPDAAASFRRVEARAGRPIDVNDSYRDYDAQMEKYRAYQRYLAGGPWAPRALHPDLSMHCKGLAIDSDDHALMRAAREDGWRDTAHDEPWHFDYFRDLDRHYGEPAGGGSTPFPPVDKPVEKKEETVERYSYKDVIARSNGRTVAPGKSFHLSTKTEDAGAKSNVVGKVGEYSTTIFITASGAPGDALEVQPFLNDSGMHGERFVFDKHGVIRESLERKPAVTSGVAVYVRVTAPSSNTKAAKVTVLDVESFRWEKA